MAAAAPRRSRFAWPPYLFVAAAVAGLAAYANSAYLVTDPDGYGLYPPFEPRWNRIGNDHLGAEYLNIARALLDGRGFSDPFHGETGPTAWMPPLLPLVQAGVLWLCGGDIGRMTAVVVVLQSGVLIFTGWLVLLASGRALERPRPWLVAEVYLLTLLFDFNAAFQYTHDSWFLMLGLGVVGVAWSRLPDRPGGMWAFAWGAAGGLAALCGPVLGLVWGVLTLSRWRERKALLLVAAGAAVALAPWTARNYLVFGRLMPVKSNLNYELYQSQCQTPDGLVRNEVFGKHPYNSGRERRECELHGEAAYLDDKGRQFRAALWRNPGDFVVRAWNRLCAATVLYVPTDKREETLPRWFAAHQAAHPLPFLAVLVLLMHPRPLHRFEWAALLVYAAWLLPYVVISYYPRYAFPLAGVKAFLCCAAIDRLLGLVRRNTLP